MEAWPAPPSQGFYFTHYQKFHQRWCCAAHSLNSESHPDQIAREWGRHLCTATVAEGNRVRQRKLGRGDRSATGSPTDVWTKTLRKSPCMSVTSFYSHGLFRPSCLLEESSWVGGFVWPRSLGGQAFHQLLTQGCQPIHPQNLSMRGHGALICKCAVLLGFFSVFRELRTPLLWSGLSDREVRQAVFHETVDLRSTERAKGMELDFFICKGAF